MPSIERPGTCELASLLQYQALLQEAILCTKLRTLMLRDAFNKVKTTNSEENGGNHKWGTEYNVANWHTLLITKFLEKLPY